MSRSMSTGEQGLRIDLSGAFIRRTNLSGANLENADLRGADCTGAFFRGVNFRNARLDGTVLRGADLTDALNLTEEQLSAAIVDDATILPNGRKVTPPSR